ncbi:hypothetical protein [Escherichia coli]|uniref:Uncharacterized protein n=1 Tax=Escherichia phage 121Q TaxID=1555202 RepID=A0A097EXL8_9CAUD|nr:hypothetical protein PBI_121Q_304 [Escherichia phage 121Q]EGE5867852.1 hypothetical protein [Escherichia coli]MED6562270.1 hypothetical protein [Escherichia coli O157]AIT14194.1 hypothetical protein PBI_121Q_304 [Escherichia phage 121Q]EKR8628418.1 hypothetical protein [Escherichia coli]ELQ3159076.1 hypothetical protein [Escherichia coli]
MITKFFATREQARIVAREEGETFKDMGKDAPKGQRWAVQFKEISDIVNSPEPVLTAAELKQAQELAEVLNAQDDFLKGSDIEVTVNANAWTHADHLANLKRPSELIRNQKEIRHDRKGNRVTVYSKRRQVI